MLAEELLKKEVLYQADLERLIGKRPFDEERKNAPPIELAPTDGVQPQDIVKPTPA